MTNNTENKDQIPEKAPVWFTAAMSNMSKQINGVRTELTEQINGVRTDLTTRMDKLDGRMDKLDGRMDKLEVRFNSVEGKIDKVEVRLDSVEGKIDKVEVRLDSVEGKIDRVEVRLDSVEGKIDRVGKRVGGLGRRLGQFTELLVLPGVLQAFRKQGYNAVTVKQDERFYLGARTVAEVDILLRNDQGEYIAIEVKTASDSSDIKSIEKHRIQLQVIEPLLKRDDPEFKRLLGGYICMIPAQEVQKAVLNAGLYALMARGIEIELYIPESLQAGK